MSIKGLGTLETWVRAMENALRMDREVLPLIPSEEKWDLNQQLRRSSSSLPANIAEGYGRYYHQDNIRFCYIARGSLEETLSHLVMCYDLKYLKEALFGSLEEDGEKLSQLINSYSGCLKRTKQGQSEPGVGQPMRENPVRYDFSITDTIEDI